jgi:uncharacterized protein (DUF58 family)
MDAQSWTSARPVRLISSRYPALHDIGVRIGVRLPIALRGPLAPVAAITTLGWVVLVGSVVGWFAGQHLHWVELCLLAVTGLLTFVLCWVIAIGRMSLQVAIGLDRQRIDVGGSAQVTVTATNTARRQFFPARLEIPDGSRVRVFDLSGLVRGAAHSFDPFAVPGAKRGVIRIGPATSVRGDPFGLVRRTVTWAGSTELLVHPRRVPLPPLGSGLLHDLEGRVTEHISASDLEFHTLREYVPSDDARHIHWRSSAKVASARPGTSFLVRQFLETRRTHLLVIVDGSAAAYREAADFETAICAGASVAQRAIGDKLQVTLLVSNQLAHEATLPRALDACARAEFAPGADAAGLIARGLRVAPRITSVLIITGSVPTYPDLRHACLRIPRQLRTLAIQVDPNRETGVVASGSLTALNLNQLAELPVLIRERGGR